MLGFFAYCISKDKKLYRAMKNILGFYPQNIHLYRLAFMHRSASRVNGGLKSNNERLEYLGDSVISTAVAHYLFKRYPNKDEGFLTEMRSKMVSRATLNKVAAKMGLHELLNIDAKSGTCKSADGNAFEALIGAVFLDKGYRFTEKILLRRVVGIHIDMDEMENREWNYKSKLIDWCQKERFKVQFQVLNTMHQKGRKLYKVAVKVGDECWGEGLDQSVKAAEQIASENAYKSKVIPYIEAQSPVRFRRILPEEMEDVAIEIIPVPKSELQKPFRRILPEEMDDVATEITPVPKPEQQETKQAQSPTTDIPLVAEPAPVYGNMHETTISAFLFATASPEKPAQEEA